MKRSVILILYFLFCHSLSCWSGELRETDGFQPVQSEGTRITKAVLYMDRCFSLNSG